MKKFLFTLAALLMAGSMFADNYFYMDNITLTKDEAANGCAKVVNVRAHFDEAVSAWQAEFTLPEGVTIGAQAKGSDLTLTFLGMFEDEETLETYFAETTYTPDIGTNDDKTKVIVSVYTTKEYDDAHNAYGVCWRPGDYDQMWRVRLVFPAGFKGGDIVLNSQASCGVSVMPPYTPCTLKPIDKTTEVRIKADKPEIAVDGDDYTKTVTITAEEDATIYYSTDGVNYQVYSAPIVFDEEGTYKVYAYAEGPGEGVERKSKSDVAESDEFTIIEQLKDLNGTIELGDVTEGGKVTVTYTPGEGDPENVELAVVVKDKDGNVVENAYADGVITLPDYGEYTVTVTASATGYNDKTFDAEPVTWKEVIAKPTITFSGEETTTMTITVSCETEGVTLYVNGEAVEGNPYSYTVTRADVYTAGTVNVTAVAKKGNLESETATGSKAWIVKEVVYAPVPEITMDENYVVTAAVEGEELGAEGSHVITLYLVKSDGTRIPVDNPYHVTQTDEVQYLTFVAKATPMGDELENMVGEGYFVIPALDELPGKIVFSEVNQDNGQFTVTYEGTVENVTLTLDDETITLVRNKTNLYKLPDYGTYPVTATASAEGYKSITEDATLVWKAPVVYETPAPEITYITDYDNEKVIITVTGEGTVTAAVETAEGTKNYTDEDGDGKIVIEIPFGEEANIANVTATALATTVPEDYDAISETPGKAEKSIEIPALPAKTEKPTITYQYGQAEVDENGNVIKDGRYATITITNNDEDPDAVIEYWIGEPGEEPTEEDWLTYNPERPVTIAGEGTYVVMARAKAEGKRMSDVAEETIKIDKTTSVNELVNGKTVAGVRYFNMAGQEMQEANGITIVVTTYTDGTTSAVKVIK